MKHIVKILLLSLCVCSVSCGNGNVPTEPGKIGSEMKKSAKRGVAYNFPRVEDAIALSPYISWNYNWGNSISEESMIPAWFDSNEIDYCPMCWSGSYSAAKIRAYVAAHPNTKYLLAFNEPNLTDQANMVPSKAAELWPDVLALAKELNLKLVSPAMNYGTLAGYSDPIKWLDEFFQQPGVSLDDIYAISLHCYMASPEAVRSYVSRFEKYGKPVWMTEFCAWENTIGNATQQIMYMTQVLNYFEQSDMVERYAWFIPRYKSIGTYPYMQMLTNDTETTFTELGRVYCGFSSFDKSVWLKMPVKASKYVATDDNYKVQVMLSTDTEAPDHTDTDLMLYAFSTDAATEYQVYVENASSELKIRYTSFATSSVVLSVDGAAVSILELPKTGSNSAWTEISFPVSIKAGQHTIGFSVLSGSFNMSQFTF